MSDVSNPYGLSPKTELLCKIADLIVGVIFILAVYFGADLRWAFIIYLCFELFSHIGKTLTVMLKL